MGWNSIAACGESTANSAVTRSLKRLGGPSTRKVATVIVGRPADRDSLPVPS